MNQRLVLVGAVMVPVALCGCVAAPYVKLADRPARYETRCTPEESECEELAEELCQGRYFVIRRRVEVAKHLPYERRGFWDVLLGSDDATHYTLTVGCGARYGIQP